MTFHRDFGCVRVFWCIFDLFYNAAKYSWVTQEIALLEQQTWRVNRWYLTDLGVPGHVLVDISCYWLQWACVHQPLLFKPWPNGVASRHKLKTWVYLWLHLARPCMHLRWLAMNCAHFGHDQICREGDESFSPFDHPTQVNAKLSDIY